MKSMDSVPSKANLAHNDIDFLKVAWVNLQELPADEPADRFPASQANSFQPNQSPIDQMNQMDDEGFQQVISKGTKKAKKTTLLKSTYSTRSKVGPHHL